MKSYVITILLGIIFSVLSVNSVYAHDYEGCQRMGSDGSGMSERRTMTYFEGKTGDDADKAFLSEMIDHHQDALDMSRDILKKSSRPEIRALAENIISGQSREIDQMRSWQNQWYR